MSRSLKKGPFVDHQVLAKVEKARALRSQAPIRVWSRRSMIVPDMVGLTFEVHNGKKFISVFVTENMVGMRLGELAPTRIFKSHPTSKAKGK